MQFIDSMGFDSVSLLGHYLGGAIATQAAAMDKRILAVVLVSSAGPYPHRGHCPKVIWAEDDRIVEPQISEILKEIAPSGPRLHFETGGHNIQKTRAVEIAQKLCPWIQEEINPSSGQE